MLAKRISQGLALALLWSAVFCGSLLADSVEKRSFFASPIADDALVHRLQKSRARHFHFVGRTSLVFRVSLDKQVDAAFKARSQKRPWGARSEVAAYQLSKLLNLAQVPPAVERWFTRAEIRTELEPAERRQWASLESEALWESGGLRGALIYWVPDLEDIRLDERKAMREWQRWLNQKEGCPQDKRMLAADISTMVAFDYLIANWDRWSGGNIKTAAHGKHLVFRDHDAAFSTPLPALLHERVLPRSFGVQRFSRSFVDALQQLSTDDLHQHLQIETDSPTLTTSQMRDLVDRRNAFLSYVGLLVEVYGEAQVLAFP